MGLKKVGYISEAVVNALKLNIAPGAPIYLGDSNIEHMKSKHGADYQAYGYYVSDILKAPDYVAKNKNDDSIEYVKEIPISSTDFIKVAVRVSPSGQYYARTLYKLNANRVRNFIAKGFLIRIKT